jgi:hypothetical protein
VRYVARMGKCKIHVGERPIERAMYIIEMDPKEIGFTVLNWIQLLFMSRVHSLV